MEKRIAHHSLATVKAHCEAGTYRLTRGAAVTAAGLDFSRGDIVALLLSLTVADFYKSMTSYNDYTQWQDVYRPKVGEQQLYVKLTLQDGLLILSFKEL